MVLAKKCVMRKPTEQQLESALAVSVGMREQEHDLHFVAKSLLNRHYRWSI